MSQPVYSKPFIKWVGGKTQIIDTILAHIPMTIHNYYEPFLGGGSVLLAVLDSMVNGQRTITGTIYACDINDVLIHTYINIQTRPEEVITQLEGFVRDMSSSTCIFQKRHKSLTGTEAYYYTIRDTYNNMNLEEKCSPRGSALFIVLNKTCFRGLYREGPHGFNVPYGNYTHPSIYNPDHIMYISNLIQPVIFKCCTYDTLLTTVQFEHDDVIYMDPPYVKLSKTSFDGYTSNGFNSDRLFDICNTITDVRITMSNSNAPKVIQKLHGWHISYINCKRSIHAYDPSSTITEIIATNWT